MGIATPYLSARTTLTIWFFWLNLQDEALERSSGVGLPTLLCMTVGSRVISFPKKTLEGGELLPSPHPPTR